MSSVDEVGAAVTGGKLAPSKSAQSQAWRLAWEQAFLKAGGSEERSPGEQNGRPVTGTGPRTDTGSGALPDPAPGPALQSAKQTGQSAPKPDDRVDVRTEDLARTVRRLWSAPAGIRTAVALNQKVDGAGTQRAPAAHLPAVPERAHPPATRTVHLLPVRGGVHVVVRDAGLSGSKAAEILQRLLGVLSDHGIRPMQMTLNGKVLWHSEFDELPFAPADDERVIEIVL